MKNVYLQLACNICAIFVAKSKLVIQRSPVHSGNFVNLPQVTTIDRFDCI